MSQQLRDPISTRPSLSGGTDRSRARNGLDALEAASVPTVCVTTRATQTTEHHAERLRVAGVDGVPTDALTSADIAAASLLGETQPGIGTDYRPGVTRGADASAVPDYRPDSLAASDTALRGLECG